MVAGPAVAPHLLHAMLTVFLLLNGAALHLYPQW
jgi:hypothetical protein